MKGVEVKVPDEAIRPVIDEHIRLAITEALGRNPERLVAEIVNQAMQTKRDYYQRKTIFQESVEEMIRHEAEAVFGAWLEEKKPIIRAAIVKRLASEESIFFEKIADQIVKGLATSFYVSCTLKVED